MIQIRYNYNINCRNRDLIIHNIYEIIIFSFTNKRIMNLVEIYNLIKSSNKRERKL